MNKPNRVFFIILVFLLLISCRKEAYELVEAPKETSLGINSAVASLLQRTSMNDGSNDNIIDRANCFNIELPVTVRANGQEIIVESESDFDRIETIFDEFNTDEDVLDITFPIEIVLNDFSEVTVANNTELTSLASGCLGENDDDDDIECVDFVYPITASLFNKITELTSKVTITDDKQLYGFVDDFNENIVITMDFPVTMVLPDGLETAINDLIVLESFIEGADNSCDEDDDFDYNDDDVPNISEQEFADLLASCKLLIEEFELNGQDLSSTYNQYIFNFNSDGSISADLNGVISTGTWSASTTNNVQVLSITMDSLTDLNNAWNLNEIETENNGVKIELKKNGDEIEFKQDCT